MSLTSLFLSLFPPKAKPAPPANKDQSPNGPTARELELEAELERATFALDHWRTSWHALWADNERLGKEIMRYRQRYESQHAHSDQQALLSQQDPHNQALMDRTCSPARDAVIAPNPN